MNDETLAVTFAPRHHSIHQLYDTARFKNRSLRESIDLKKRHLSHLCGQVKETDVKQNSNARKRNWIVQLLKRRVPILSWLPAYKLKSFLVPDILAGVTVGIMNIPQCLSYAMLATLNPVYGLYVSFFPLLVYGIFGTSRHLAIGAIAIVSLLTGSVVDRVAREHPLPPAPTINMTAFDSVPILGDGDYRVVIASTLALLVGAFQFLMGLSGLGFISSYFSEAFVSGYTCGSAVHVVVSQIKDIFGIKNVTKHTGAFEIPKV
jgi:MFS superfamily sulfate permease-like transporter